MNAAHSDPAVAVARGREDVVVADELVRHSLSARVVHWAVAFSFLVCLLTGLPIWTPLFGWTAHLFGGLTVCRWLHPWAGLVYFAASFAMFLQWKRDMVFEPGERGWLGPKLLRYMRYEGVEEDVGKYNGGQKLLFWAVSLAALGLLAASAACETESFAAGLREARDALARLVHELEPRIATVALPFAFAGRMFVVGRGAEFSTARCNSVACTATSVRRCSNSTRSRVRPRRWRGSCARSRPKPARRSRS